jgi:hypothetical protein
MCGRVSVGEEMCVVGSGIVHINLRREKDEKRERKNGRRRLRVGGSYR